MKVVSNGQFWLCTIALLIFWIFVLTTAFSSDSKLKKQISLSTKNGDDELKNYGICKSLCKQCNCLDFYCGEECICECNDDHADTQCIREIQLNAQSLNIPFEVLIQGPTANNFVRHAIQFEQNRERILDGYRNKRSTVTIYKPNQGNQNGRIEKEVSIVTDKSKNRRKRSNNNNFDWFSETRSNLLRPAPLGGHRRRAEELQKHTAPPRATTMSSVFDNSWIFDNPSNILTPSPLKKFKSRKPLSNVNSENIEAAPKPQIDHNFNDDFSDDEKINAFDQKDLPDSYENLLSSLYSRLFKNDFNRNDDKYLFLPHDESQDYSTRDHHYLSFKENSGQAGGDNDLFLDEEEEEEEGKTLQKSQESQNGRFGSSSIKDDSTTSQVSSPAVRKDLHDFRIPWLKPGKLLENFKRVIAP